MKNERPSKRLSDKELAELIEDAKSALLVTMFRKQEAVRELKTLGERFAFDKEMLEQEIVSCDVTIANYLGMDWIMRRGEKQDQPDAQSGQS